MGNELKNIEHNNSQIETFLIENEKKTLRHLETFICKIIFLEKLCFVNVYVLNYCNCICLDIKYNDNCEKPQTN